MPPKQINKISPKIMTKRLDGQTWPHHVVGIVGDASNFAVEVFVRVFALSKSHNLLLVVEADHQQVCPLTLFFSNRFHNRPNVVKSKKNPEEFTEFL